MRCENISKCRGYQNIIQHRKSHTIGKNCPQNLYKSHLQTVYKTRKFNGDKFPFSSLATRNKIVELESTIEEYKRVKNFGCFDCANRDVLKHEVATSTDKNMNELIDENILIK